MATRDHDRNAEAARNRLVAGIAIATAVAMVGAAYAAAPLYFLFCRATGFAGTTQVAASGPALRGERALTVRFDANVAPGLPWTFEAETASIRLRTGATATVYFKVRNRVAHATAATAVYNVTPDVMGAYFDKISCFCFTEQKLNAHEQAEWPVVFFLDPKLDTDTTMTAVDAITLSYTMFAPPNQVKTGAAKTVKSGAAGITTLPPG